MCGEYWMQDISRFSHKLAINTSTTKPSNQKLTCSKNCNNSYAKFILYAHQNKNQKYISIYSWMQKSINSDSSFLYDRCVDPYYLKFHFYQPANGSNCKSSIHASQNENQRKKCTLYACQNENQSKFQIILGWRSP